MSGLQNNPIQLKDRKKKPYLAPMVEQVQLDNEISMVMMSLPPTEFPQQDPLLSLKVFKLFN
jgi:hypothetical protein